MSDPDHDFPDGEHNLTLDGLLQTVYDSVVVRVRANAERSIDHLLAHYFPVDPQTGLPSPRMVQFPLPGPNGTPIQRELPLFSLVRHDDIAIEHMVLRMPLSIHEKPGADGRPNLTVSFDASRDGELVKAELEIRFRGVEGPEGLARINDAIVKQIGVTPR